MEKTCILCGKPLSKKQNKFCCRAHVTSYFNSNLTGEEARRWNGGRYKTTEGYIRIYKPEHPNSSYGYVYEHRLVMEAHLGRYLKPNEIVHHLNGLKDDNRIENIELFLGQSSHCRHHNQERKAAPDNFP